MRFEFLILFVTASVTAFGQSTNAAAGGDISTTLADALRSFESVLVAVLSLTTALASIYARIKASQARVLPVLIRAVEEYGCDKLKKQIYEKADASGVEKTLNKMVESETQSITRNGVQ